MKISYLITGLGVGGAESQVISLANRMQEKGQTPELLVLTGANEWIEATKNLPIKFLNINKKNPFSWVIGLIKIRFYLAKNNTDILHAHMFHANLFARMCRLLFFKKVIICTAHSNNEGGALRMFLYRLTNSLNDLFTHVSEDSVKAFINQKACKSHQIKTIHNGINIDKYDYEKFSIEQKNQVQQTQSHYKTEKNESIWLAIGRLCPPKDYPNMLQAFKIFTDKYPENILLIAGEGELKQELMQLAENLNISSKVHFLGIRHDISILLNACDYFLMSSAWEGLPMVILEAMASKKLIIATDCGGIKEVIDEKFLAKINDSQDLADKIEMIFNQKKELSPTLVIQKFSLEAITKQWINIYKTAIQK